MPSRPVCVVICVMWMFMTGWLVKKELLPQFQTADLNYKRVLSDRTVDEITEWDLEYNGRMIGVAEFLIQPQSDRTIQLITNFRVTEGLLKSFRFGTRSTVYRDWRLHSFMIELVVPDLDNTTKRYELVGEITDDELVLTVEGTDNPAIPRESRFRITPENLVMNKFIPVDRIPGLSVGNEWTSQSFNPVALVPGPAKWLMSADPFESVINRVTKTERIANQDQQNLCFVVQHTTTNSRRKTHTWVRVSDDLVIKREVFLPGLLTLTGDDDKLTFTLKHARAVSRLDF